jgi:filamentous hemagglutinin family protein
MQQGVLRVGIVSSITLSCLAILSPARSQIVPDASLPTNSSVTPGCTVCTIEGGTLRGVNLFHSFSEFSVPTGGEAFFNNPAQIENILTRVTGSNISHIDGLIRANDAANLFLVNPNGIIFGVNSRLEIGGSFFASTADSLVLENGADLYQFSASNPTAPPLLTITAPIGLQFGSSPGSIVNQSRLTKTIADVGSQFNEVIGLEVQPGKTLGLIGGNVTLAGGFLKAGNFLAFTTGNSTAPNGRIELGSVADNSFVRLIPQDNGFAVGYEGVQNFGDIELSQAAQVNAQDVIINARRLLVRDGSSVSAAGRTANLIVNASDSVQLMGSGEGRYEISFLDAPESSYFGTFTNSSSLSSSSFGLGGPANLTINTGKLLIQDGSSVSAVGIAANLIVNASDWVQVIGSFDARNDRTSPAQPQYSFSNTSTIASSLSSYSTGFTEGIPGNLTINTGRLLIQDGASVWALGTGANLIVNASDSVQVSGFVDERTQSTSPNQSIYDFSFTVTRPSSMFSESVGLEGVANLTINTERLLIQNGASVSSTAYGGGANLTLNASESVQVIGSVDGRSEFISRLQPQYSYSKTVPIPSTLSSSSYLYNGRVEANLMIHTQQLLVQDKAQVRVFAYSFGNSFFGSSGGEAIGNLSVSAGSIRLDNQARIGVFAQASNDINAPANAPVNAGGNITLTVEDLVLRHNSEISTISFNLTSDFTLPNNPTFSSNDPVNVIIDKLNQARTSGNITGITNIGNVGNITINAGAIAAIPSENSDIIAFNTQGGGNVTLTAQRIFGFRLPEFPGQLTDNSDITSSGTVTVNTLDVDPSRGLTKLPEETVDRTQQIAQDCAAVGEEGNKFIITGRGGLPQSPEEVLTRDTVLEDLGGVVSWEQGTEQEEVGKASATSSKFDFPEVIASPPPNQLVEAQGWIMGADGKVILTAQPPTPTPQRNWQPPVNCQVTPTNSPP